jgi:hypothetical protein
MSALILRKRCESAHVRRAYALERIHSCRFRGGGHSRASPSRGRSTHTAICVCVNTLRVDIPGFRACRCIRRSPRRSSPFVLSLHSPAEGLRHAGPICLRLSAFLSPRAPPRPDGFPSDAPGTWGPRDAGPHSAGFLSAFMCSSATERPLHKSKTPSTPHAALMGHGSALSLPPRTAPPPFSGGAAWAEGASNPVAMHEPARAGKSGRPFRWASLPMIGSMHFCQYF